MFSGSPKSTGKGLATGFHIIYAKLINTTEITNPQIIIPIPATVYPPRFFVWGL